MEVQIRCRGEVETIHHDWPPLRHCRARGASSLSTGRTARVRNRPLVQKNDVPRPSLRGARLPIGAPAPNITAMIDPTLPVRPPAQHLALASPCHGGRP
jgi:hypothetical protein